MAEADKLYAEGQFEKARLAYAATLQETPDQPTSFFYNFGTIALQSGKMGEAYVLLKKAALASPFDSQIQNNLRQAQEKISPALKAIQPVSWFSWWPVNARAVAWPIWLIASLLLLLPASWALRGSDRLQAWEWSALALSGFCFFGTLASAWQDRMPAAGIIAEAKVLSGPEKTYPGISALEPGSLVNIEEVRGNWLKVRYFDANHQETVGWVESPTALKF